MNANERNSHISGALALVRVYSQFREGETS
jgi:hypothetical protein